MSAVMKKMIYSLVSVKNKTKELTAFVAGMKGVSGADMEVVTLSDIAAVVCEIAPAGLVIERAGALEYAGVIETLASEFTLLPMQFGSVMESNAAVTGLLGRNFEEIGQNLLKVENKVEFGLKVLCDPGALAAELEAGPATGIRNDIEPGSEGKNSVYKDWVMKKLQEHRREELLVSFADRVIAGIADSLKQFNAVHKVKKRSTAASIADAVFLLDRERKDDVIKAVRDLQSNYPALNFLLTGPWPPYNFVEVTLK
jgi:hypothetical protein